mmetsp:Transcript_28241/g.86295  ORF Transcript_28241/g.86295 Transcript_28241/m.86295 type:complete len:100 (-) Transcript_28241:1038-1337(-)
MIESGFSREQAEVALAAVNATDKSHIPKAIEWQLKRDVEINKKESEMEREAVWFDKMDFDGYALMWALRPSPIHALTLRCSQIHSLVHSPAVAGNRRRS